MWRRRLAVLGLAAAASALAGCSALAYYGQSVAGHLAMLRQARPVADWLADPATPEPLRERLSQAASIRRYAVDALALPDNASYTRYADLGREAVVWNVVAAPELSLKLKTWCYPVMGCVGYRGYFDRAEAEAEGRALREAGWEVHVYGVPAYSTLGWTNWLGGDPLLNTFVRGSPAEAARLVFHELAHQVVYAADDTEFNESYATTAERLGLARWRSDHPEHAPDARALALARLQAQVREANRQARRALQQIYASGEPDEVKRQHKAQLLAELRSRHAQWRDGPWAEEAALTPADRHAWDRWFERMNNAALALQAAYDGWVPAFERLHAEQGGQFAPWHQAVKALAALPKPQRSAALQALMPPAQGSATQAAAPAASPGGAAASR